MLGTRDSEQQKQPPQCLRPATLLKKRLWHRCSPVNFVKFLRTHFLQNTSGPLLLELCFNSSSIYFQKPQVFIRKDVLRSFAKFTRKYLCQSHFFNKVASLRPTKSYFFNITYKFYLTSIYVLIPGLMENLKRDIYCSEKLDFLSRYLNQVIHICFN